MRKSKGLFAFALVAGLLGACALIPPIPIGPGALGYQRQELIVPLNNTTRATVSARRSFTDIERPSFPIAPSSFRSVQGFSNDAQVHQVLGTPPDVLTLTNGTLTFTVEDDSGSPDSVTTSVDFGPLELRKAPSCTSSTCGYTFADPQAAARALTFTVRGAEFRRLLDIITTGDEQNWLDVTLTVTTDAPATTLTLNVEVIENYIDF